MAKAGAWKQPSGSVFNVSDLVVCLPLCCHFMHRTAGMCSRPLVHYYLQQKGRTSCQFFGRRI